MTRKTWEEFRAAGLLWWVNRILHLFGWAIAVVVADDGRVTDIYPAQVKFRGFESAVESNGFIALTEHLADNLPRLVFEVNES